jgi:hypothetical protein
MNGRLLALSLLSMAAGCTLAGEADRNANAAKFDQTSMTEVIASDPSKEPQDSASAVNSPDAYAWRLFIALNWPADIEKKAPDSAKNLGDVGPVVWETWANARFVISTNGSDPGPWLSSNKGIKGPNSAIRSFNDFDPMALQQELRSIHSGPAPKVDPDVAGTSVNETRLNKETYEFIRTNNLYNLAGQKALAASGKVDVQFPLHAKEIKAQWREIPDDQKSRYHWAEISRDGKRLIVGLTALHITTKDLPNWFWATFEHVDNPKIVGNEDWKLPSRDSFACAGQSPDCNLAPKGIGLEGTVWENYRLRGTQIDFTSARGEVTLLANSQPEEGFQRSSSCITCHARATIASDGSRLCFFKPNGEGHVGTPRPEWFIRDGKTKFTQLDFVWAMFRANDPQNSDCEI